MIRFLFLSLLLLAGPAFSAEIAAVAKAGGGGVVKFASGTVEGDFSSAITSCSTMVVDSKLEAGVEVLMFETNSDEDTLAEIEDAEPLQTFETGTADYTFNPSKPELRFVIAEPFTRRTGRGTLTISCNNFSSNHAVRPVAPLTFLTTTVGWGLTANSTIFYDESFDLQDGFGRGEHIILDEWTGDTILFDDASDQSIYVWDRSDPYVPTEKQTFTVQQLDAFVETVVNPLTNAVFTAAEAALRVKEPELGCIANETTMYMINNVNTPSLCDGAIVDVAGIYTLTRDDAADTTWALSDYKDLPKGNCEDSAGDGMVFRYNGMMCPDSKIYLSTGGGGGGGVDYDIDGGQVLDAGIYEYDFEANDLVRDSSGDIGPVIFEFPASPDATAWPGIFKLNYHHGSGLMHSMGIDAGNNEIYLIEVDWLHADGPTTTTMIDLSGETTTDPDVTFGLEAPRGFAHDPMTGISWVCHNGSSTTVAQCPALRTSPRPWLVHDRIGIDQ